MPPSACHALPALGANASFRNHLAGAVFHFLTQSPNIMKRWAILTILLYAMALLLLTVPVILIAFGNWGKPYV